MNSYQHPAAALHAPAYPAPTQPQTHPPASSASLPASWPSASAASTALHQPSSVVDKAATSSGSAAARVSDLGPRCPTTAARKRCSGRGSSTPPPVPADASASVEANLVAPCGGRRLQRVRRGHHGAPILPTAAAHPAAPATACLLAAVMLPTHHITHPSHPTIPAQTRPWRSQRRVGWAAGRQPGG